MARGITQEQVNGAIEQLLLSGERPTIERVRAALGTGSPNTLTRMLDVWWQGLGERLTARRRSAAIPDAPAAVVDAASALWEAALAAGKVHAEALVAPERAALADVVAKADASVNAARASLSTVEAQLAAAVADADALRATLVLRDQRIVDMERHHAETVTALQAQVEFANALSERLSTAQRDAQRERAVAASERETLLAHARQAEDRAYGEVDRLRQEIKGLKAQVTSQVREHAAALRAAEQARRTAESDGQRAQREVATLRGRLEALLANAPAKANKGPHRGRRDSPDAAPVPAPQAPRRSTGRRTP
jgi:predicted  nucleic acid-binding Zn-ribbon protein